MQIRTVVAPVDFSTLSERELALAVEICRAFGARLVLHHNQHGAPLAFARAWRWQEQHRATQGRHAQDEHALRELMARVPTDVPVEAVVSNGVAAPAILAVAEKLDADLLIVGSHGGDSDDHSSVVERLIAQSRCPVLAVQEGVTSQAPLRLVAGEPAEVVVPVDFGGGTAALLDYAFAMASDLVLRLRLLHVLSVRTSRGAEDASAGREAARVAAVVALDRLQELVPEALRDRVVCTVTLGEAAATIVDACRDADFLLIGEHAHGLRGLLTHDTARDVLRRAPCPVWFVPPRLAA